MCFWSVLSVAVAVIREKKGEEEEEDWGMQHSSDGRREGKGTSVGAIHPVPHKFWFNKINTTGTVTLMSS